MQFNAGDGWYFERLADGQVHIAVQPDRDKAPILDIIFEPDLWCSIVTSLTGATTQTFKAVRDLHRAK